MKTFLDVANTFRESAGGTDAFKALSKASFELMKADPQNAAAYFVLGTAARSYVTQYEDQGVELKVADAATAIVAGMLDDIARALEMSAAARLAAFGEVATRYEFDVHNF